MKVISLTTSYPRFEGDDSSVFVHRLNLKLAEHVSVVVLVPASDRDSEIGRPSTLVIRRFLRLGVGFWRCAFGAGLINNLKQSWIVALELPLLVLEFAYQALRCREPGAVLHANWILPGMSAWLVSLLTGQRYFITLRGSDVQILRNFFLRMICIPALTRASGVVCVSESLQREVQQLYPRWARRITVIENGVDIPAEIVSQNLPPSPKKIIVAIGSVIRRKNQVAILEALATVPGSEYELRIIGANSVGEYPKQVLQAIERLKLGARVRMLGAIPPQEVFKELAHASLFISASSYEGRPNAVVEAIASGLPVLLSDIPAHREIMSLGAIGKLSDFGDSSKVASEIEFLLEGSQTRSAAKEFAALFVQNNSWGRCAQRYLQLFAHSSDKRSPGIRS